jgi:hypothetical protein
VAAVTDHAELADAIGQDSALRDPAGNLFVAAFATSPEGLDLLGTIRLGLADPPHPPHAVRSVARAFGELRKPPWDVTEVCVIIGYGPAEVADPVIDLMRRTLIASGMPLFDVLRVHDGRCWSWECPDEGHGAAGPGMVVDPVSDAAIQLATEIGQQA